MPRMADRSRINCLNVVLKPLLALWQTQRPGKNEFLEDGFVQRHESLPLPFPPMSHLDTSILVT